MRDNYVKLGDCCEVVSGATPRRDRDEYWGGDIPWVTPKELSGLESPVLCETGECISELGLKSCSARMLPKGSILFSSRAPIGHVAIVGESMCTNQGFKSLVPSQDVDSGYLYWCMRFLTPQIVSRGRGATFKEVSKKIIEDVSIPLPPLPEQKRIAAILDKADELRRKRRKSLALLDTLLQSTFLDMFGDPTTNPKGWSVSSLSDVVARLDGGKNVAPSEDHTGFRVLKVSAVTYGEYRPAESKFLPADFKVPESYLVRNGDLLISRANTVELIGATAFVWETPANMVLPDKIWKFIWRADAKIEPLFVFYLSHTPEFRRMLGQRASGTSGSMKNISKAKLLGMPIPLPPLDLQCHFAAIVESVEKQKARMRSHLAELDTLFASLQSRAFKGEL
ncbi:MAG: restriction endonuclease subunit S [Verrucomicrobia bacterium]|nr:restriction endonuclease subunit S [Verrucomicrobiota bacterium]